jgi:hypothetical protein
MNLAAGAAVKRNAMTINKGSIMQQKHALCDDTVVIMCLAALGDVVVL